jgi:hypothetical protein
MKDRDAVMKYHQLYDGHPEPIGIDFDDVVEVIKKYLELGIEIPSDYDWYGKLPEGVVV